MTVYFGKTAHIRIPDDAEPNFTWWADYTWDKNTELWTCRPGSDANSGFFHKHNFPYSMTDQEMLVVALKYS